jgi:hypothetical protein
LERKVVATVSLSLSNKSGQELLDADASGTGGTLYSYSYSSGTKQQIANFGVSSSGDGGLLLFDKSGNLIQH